MRTLVKATCAAALFACVGASAGQAAKAPAKRQAPAPVIFRAEIASFPDHAQYAFSGPISLTRIADAAWSIAPSAEPPNPQETWWAPTTPNNWSAAPPPREAKRRAKSGRKP